MSEELKLLYNIVGMAIGMSIGIWLSDNEYTIKEFFKSIFKK